MKSFVVIFGLVIATFTNNTMAQELYPAAMGPGAGQPSRFSADLKSLIPGRIWAEAKLADNGVGFEGSYFTVGGKSRLFQDALGGRWLGEGQGHIAFDDGGYFGNLGIERVFSVESAPADVSLGVFYDRDSSGLGTFRHSFDQIGVSGSIKTPKFDIRSNGYFPVGTSGHSTNCFLGNNILTRIGIDSALKGFDVELRLRPEWIAMVNGTVDFGGYSYGSDLVDSFNGFRVRLGMQGSRGANISLELNHDERFDTTGILQVGWHFGNGSLASSHEYSLVGRDLDKTIRADHITRFYQEPIRAVSQVTGDAFEVYHVDNTSLAGGNGSFEQRFATLAEAEAASAANDIIFVHEGDQTSTGMNNGIALQDGQYLLGDGVEHRVPVLGGSLLLCNDQDGVRPTITNTAGSAIEMANNNTVNGFIVEGDLGLTNGIEAVGVDNGTISNVDVTGSQLDGILLDGVSGDWSLTDVNVTNAFGDGFHMQNIVDPALTLAFNRGVYDGNFGNGIHIENYDGLSFDFTDITTSGNILSGTVLANHANTVGPAEINFFSHTASLNGLHGISISDVDADVNIFDATITDNTGNGVDLVDVVGNILIDQFDEDNASTITGNGVGVFAELTAGTSSLTIANTTIDGNETGVIANALNAGTVMETQLLDLVSFSDNRFGGGVFNANEGAQHSVLIENIVDPDDPVLMPVNNNGLFFNASSTVATTSIMDATVRNVAVAGSSINSNIGNGGVLGMLIEDSTVTNSDRSGISLAFDSNDDVVNRVDIVGSTVDGSRDSGLIVNTVGDARVDVNVQESGFINNGADGITFLGSDESMGLLTVNDSTASNNDNGISSSANRNGQQFLIINGSTMQDNATSGIAVQTAGTALVSGQITGNEATGNGEDGAFDTTEDSIMNMLVENNLIDVFRATNADEGEVPAGGTISTMCMSLTFNRFETADLFNNDDPADFIVEVDGNSNGIGLPVLNADPTEFTEVPFGSTCRLAIENQALDFLLEGF